jgi:hypothetical protein
MAKNIFGKSRPINKPYAIYRNGIGDYQILKTYKMAKNETNQYDRWFVYCNGDYGDMYKKDIVDNSILIQADTDWLNAYGTKQAKGEEV